MVMRLSFLDLEFGNMKGGPLGFLSVGARIRRKNSVGSVPRWSSGLRVGEIRGDCFSNRRMNESCRDNCYYNCFEFSKLLSFSNRCS